MSEQLVPTKVIVNFVVRNEGPLIFMGEPVTHRIVNIELTESQRQQLALEKIGMSCGTILYESIGQVFFDYATDAQQEGEK